MSEETKSHNSGKAFQIISLVAILCAFILSVWAYPQLPDRVPTHWNAAGQVNGYSNPLVGAFLMPLISLGVWILFFIIPHIDPKRSNFQAMKKFYWLISFVVILFLSIMHGGVLLSTLGFTHANFVPIFAFAGIGVLFIIIGNYMGKVKFNYMFGIRTPWTLANEEVWHKTHRTFGPIWVVGGVIMLFLGLLPTAWVTPLLITVIIILSLGSTVYSYLVFRRLQK